MNQVYLFLAQGFETIEALTVVDILRRADVPIKTVSITEYNQVESTHKIKVEADAVFTECDFVDATMLVLPGGMPGTANLEAHEGLCNLIEEAVKKDIKVAAICAAPSILGKKGLLSGRDATVYPGFETYLKDANVLDREVVVDGNFITGRGMGTTIDFALTILEELGYKETAQKVGRAIQFTQYYK